MIFELKNGFQILILRLVFSFRTFTISIKIGGLKIDFTQKKRRIKLISGVKNDKNNLNSIQSIVSKKFQD